MTIFNIYAYYTTHSTLFVCSRLPQYTHTTYATRRSGLSVHGKVNDLSSRVPKFDYVISSKHLFSSHVSCNGLQKPSLFATFRATLGCKSKK